MAPLAVIGGQPVALTITYTTTPSLPTLAVQSPAGTTTTYTLGDGSGVIALVSGTTYTATLATTAVTAPAIYAYGWTSDGTAPALSQLYVTTPAYPNSVGGTGTASSTAQLIGTVVSQSGTLAARPVATTLPAGSIYVATDTNSGTLYEVQSGSWAQIARGVTQLPADHAAMHLPGGTSELLLDSGAAIAGRWEPFPRRLSINSQGITTGSVLCMYGKAAATVAATNLLAAASSTPNTAATLIRGGIYTVDNIGNLTLVAATANLATTGASIVGGASNVAAFGTASGIYHLPLTLKGDLVTAQTGYTLQAETWYATALIIVGASGLPTICGASVNGPAWGIAPRLSGQRTGQTDLPASIAIANVSTLGSVLYLAAE